MITSHIETILRQVFEAEGAPDAAGLARRAARDFDLAERNEQIYQMRASMATSQIGQRFGMSARRVKQIVREQLAIRHSVA